MKTLDLIQGSPEWLEHRFKHCNASEAAAMLGLDPKTTRTQLLHMKSTGAEKEFSDWVQKNILDYGHEVEGLARQHIEVLLDNDLYPVTGADGHLSASFDGLTIFEDVGFEHKQWDETLADSVSNKIVPDSNMPQIQQQLLVSDAEKIIFVVSNGTKEKMVSMDVYPDKKWFKRITNGWEQFKKDLAEYKPRELAEKPEANAIMQLPALSIEIKGEVIASNLPKFKEDAESFIANINTDLKTDNDFANAEATVKFCDETEKKLELAKKSALAQTASIDEVMRTIDFIKDQLRTKRLDLNRKVTTEKTKIKDAIITDTKKLFVSHLEKLNDEFKGYVTLDAGYPDFVSAMKNKRTLESLHNAADTELARCKIAANEIASHIRANLAIFHDLAKDNKELFRDLQSIIYKAKDDFELLIKTRISEHEKSVAAAAQKKIEDDKKAEELAKQKTADNSPKNQETKLAGRISAPSKPIGETPVTISEKEYQQLKDDSSLLHCLLNAGVDNWSGYDSAIEDYENLKKTA